MANEGSLTHVDEHGRARMVDVSEKPVTARTASASAFVTMSKETIAAIDENRTPKGDPLETARIAGIMAAKRTSELIPLCHPLPLSHADIAIEIQPDGLRIISTASTEGKTGVEMEAMVAASVAALTLYDMCKALDKGIVIEQIRLESKTGGKSGDYRRTPIDG
ncbi:MAG TPA: cyclic pyranopterin monophosphate synthase MoaC [Blastocatellia bacterium]|nr:cyclic pyranopterin monophosphate synthase MoaC [Blastocatellia bacterium]